MNLPLRLVGDAQGLLFLGSGVPLAGQARLAAVGVADRQQEQQNPRLGSVWPGQLRLHFRQHEADWVVVEE